MWSEVTQNTEDNIKEKFCSINAKCTVPACDYTQDKLSFFLNRKDKARAFIYQDDDVDIILGFKYAGDSFVITHMMADKTDTLENIKKVIDVSITKIKSFMIENKVENIWGTQAWGIPIPAVVQWYESFIPLLIERAANLGIELSINEEEKKIELELI